MFNRIIEQLLGDGPSNRYALICTNCHEHNGLVLPEEFPYISKMGEIGFKMVKNNFGQVSGARNARSFIRPENQDHLRRDCLNWWLIVKYLIM